MAKVEIVVTDAVVEQIRKRFTCNQNIKGIMTKSDVRHF